MNCPVCGNEMEKGRLTAGGYSMRWLLKGFPFILFQQLVVEVHVLPALEHVGFPGRQARPHASASRRRPYQVRFFAPSPLHPPPVLRCDLPELRRYIIFLVEKEALLTTTLSSSSLRLSSGSHRIE